MPIQLTPLEFDLLLALARRPWQVFSREVLLEQVWGYRHAADTRLVNVHVQRLRSKIERDPEHPEIVVTVRGIGYKAGETEQADSAVSCGRLAMSSAHGLDSEGSESRWWRFPVNWWWRSLPLRVVPDGLRRLPCWCLVLGGFLLMQQATIGVIDGKKETAKNEARQAVNTAQQQLNAADLTGEVNVDKLLLDLATGFASRAGARAVSR